MSPGLTSSVPTPGPGGAEVSAAATLSRGVPIARFDTLDRRIAAAMQLNGRATWREIGQLLGSSEFTIGRRARRLMDRGLVRVTAAADPVLTGSGHPVLVQMVCQPDKASAVARALMRRPDVRFVTMVTGPFDVVAELIVTSSRELANILIDDIGRLDGVTRTTTGSVMRNFKTSDQWGQDVLGLQRPPGAGARPPRDGCPSPLDPVDQLIVGLLRMDGRCGYQKLGTAVGLSESAVRRRVESLMGSGCLTFPTIVDAQFLGYDVELMMWLHVEVSRLEEVATALARRVEVRYISATSGYGDLVAEVILRSQSDLYRFRAEVLGAQRGIRQADLALELYTLKRAYLEFTRDHSRSQ
ncbi:Lrp/AsnC family transcriptional regulator [Candidatus Nephthysia bennettiae]|uniref:Lrp/AsnC family transcriptional regulator n=1 Tax=Candidatus Nephthysia bennettiae TaxID=3127016 RepID=A0A934KFM8_9BACT|nr:Lrp/AsnC family transcriptional regulator [Candidatus Dormibacteraeota bacterium]MBJ7612971.1 Lrp/AsnC family transcriptional regulator [Candidatus Dormibacteraeota bacterium]